MDKKITLVTRNVGFIDLYTTLTPVTRNVGHIDLYTILGWCTPLYILPGRNLYSPRIKRHGSICGADPIGTASVDRVLARMVALRPGRVGALYGPVRRRESGVSRLSSVGNVSRRRRVHPSSFTARWTTSYLRPRAEAV